MAKCENCKQDIVKAYKHENKYTVFCCKQCYLENKSRLDSRIAMSWKNTTIKKSKYTK